MQLQPLNDRIVVKAASKEEMTKSGIVLPDTAEKEKPQQGEVIAVGPGKTLDNGQRSAMTVKVGDKVLFTKYGPDEVEVDGEEYLVIREEDVLAIIS
jgi:chaperonin GroES